MGNKLVKSLFASALLIAFVMPVASAAPPPDQVPPPVNDRWVFTFDQEGNWNAKGAHVSFAWTLKPFQVYNFMMDGVLLFEELEFPVDATSYRTEGATFKVMMGNTNLFSVQDNSVSGISASCAGSPRDPAWPPDPCDVAFPEGSEIMSMTSGKGTHTSLFHVEYPEKDGTINPCGTLAVRGSIDAEGSMAMFTGDLHLHFPPGQSMVS